MSSQANGKKLTSGGYLVPYFPRLICSRCEFKKEWYEGMSFFIPGSLAYRSPVPPFVCHFQSADIPEGSLVTYVASAEELSKALASAGGKLVVVYFYATWYVTRHLGDCGACRVNGC